MKRPHNFLVNATATQASVSCAWSVKTNRRTVKVVRIGYSIVCQWVSMWLLCVRVCCCCCAAVYCDCCYLFLFRCTFLRSTLWKYTKTATNPLTHIHTHTLAESARLKESQAAGGDYWESPRKKKKSKTVVVFIVVVFVPAAASRHCCWFDIHTHTDTDILCILHSSCCCYLSHRRASRVTVKLCRRVVAEVSSRSRSRSRPHPRPHRINCTNFFNQRTRQDSHFKRVKLAKIV